MSQIDRRHFLTASATAVALSASARVAANKAQNKLVLVLMGTHGRGTQLARSFNKVAGAEIAYVCDPDEKQIGKAIDAIASEGRTAPPKGIKDYREALDDPAVDGLVCAAPNHWHAAATIVACQAGKHVYVEKPCSHTPAEGEMMIDAARRHGKVVQVGMQRRSNPLYERMVEQLRDGVIGKVLLSKSYYFNNRPSLGHAEPAPPPAWFDYDLWQGPVTEQPYRSNVLHYNWHFFWHWGNGEVGNNGVHTIDISRWAMDIDFPDQVDVQGRRLRYDDDQQTPDTMTASFQCGDQLIGWEGISWSAANKSGSSIGIEFRGTGGTLFINDVGYTIYDVDGQSVEEHSARGSDIDHLQNFIDCVRTGSRPNCDIEDGHKSALFCHLANIAYRTKRSLQVNPADGHLIDGGPAAELWGCEYRQEFMPNRV